MAEGIVGEYLALLEDSGADLLAMQVGDFYEFFGDSAETVGDELDLKVSEKGSGGESYPMAGVPVDELTPYLKALVERGYRVAVADQHETAGGHARSVTRVVTPGTLLSTTDADARYLASVVRAGEVGDGFGLAFADVTTGRFLVTGVAGEDARESLLSELYRFDPAEVLPGPDVRSDDALLSRVRDRTDAALTLHETRAFEPGRATHRVREQFGEPPEGVDDGAALRAAGAVLDYVEETGTGVLASMTRLQPLAGEDHVTLDATTQRNLEVVEPMTGDGPTLFDVVDHTVTSPGARRLKEWLTRPTRDRATLSERHDAVGALTEAAMDRERVRDHLDDVYDLERLAARATSGSAGPRDLAAVRDTLAALPDLAGVVGLDPAAPPETATDGGRRGLDADADDDGDETGSATDGGGTPGLDAWAETDDGGDETDSDDDPPTHGVGGTGGRTRDTEGGSATGADRRRRLSGSPLASILDRPDREAAADLRQELTTALAPEPSAAVGDGAVIARGYDPELDAVVERHEAIQEWFDELADRESARTGITHLSVGRNKTDGYYLQVGKSEADAVPDRYEQVKTLKNSKRFTTPELEEKEREALRLEEQREELEREAFESVRESVAARAELLQDVGRALAVVDALASLAVHAVENDWTRPTLRADHTVDVRAGRHPVVEQTTEFVPNDVRLDDERTFLIVTGPNMSGKSTYMRQTALITLLAQVGSFVPAEAATVGLVDGIFTRVGALDELAGGRSTFMVEMEELSNILHAASEDSLVILDEVGRGTATYDGISIAWAATEYLHNEVRARTLFATHYHELTAMADHLPRVENVHVAVAGDPDGEDDVTFLRTVREGRADRSYGVHVADLAGVPDPVVGRAREVLDRLRREKAIEARGAGGGGSRQVVFDVGSGELRAGGEGGDESPDDDGEGEGEGEETVDPTVEAVLAELRDADPEATAPLALAERVREWQRRLEE